MAFDTAEPGLLKCTAMQVAQRTHILLSAVTLGLVQGLTEFLPVSSSGHLVVGAAALGFSRPSLLFDILLHVGTLLPVLWHYRADVIAMAAGLRGLGSPGRAWRDLPGFRLLCCVAIGTNANPLIAQTTPDLQLNKWGYIEVDPETMMSVSKPGVFAGGDIVTGAATVILAMGAGRIAARGIDKYLRSQG